MSDQHSDQACLDALREAAEELGHSPTVTEFQELDTPVSRWTISERFGGWNAAKEEAGLETYIGPEPRITDDDCLDALREAADQLGHSPSRKEFIRLDTSVSAQTISGRFDSWNAAKKQAGLETYNEFPHTQDECIAALREAAEELGHTPTRGQYIRLETPVSASALARRFRGWYGALKAANLAVTAPNLYEQENPDTDADVGDCLAALREASTELGHAPSREEYRALDTDVSVARILGNFGTWARATEAVRVANQPQPQEARA